MKTTTTSKAAGTRAINGMLRVIKDGARIAADRPRGEPTAERLGIAWETILAADAEGLLAAGPIAALAGTIDAAIDFLCLTKRGASWLQPFRAVDVAYQIPGRQTQQKVCRSQRAYDALFARVQDAGGE